MNPLKIKFTPGFRMPGDKLSPPEPAIRKIPEWYKSLTKFYGSNSEMDLDPHNNIGADGAQVSTKMCMPYFDALTMGYTYVLENDLYVDVEADGTPRIWWDGEVMLVDTRPSLDIPLPNNCHPIHYGWRMNWYYETPPGYSVLITHPMNRTDLPFYTMSGVVEADIWGLPVFTAFFLQRDFRGKIPKGTPLFQMIPFKRDNWELEVIDTDQELDRHEIKAENRRSMLYGYYKRTAWIRKIYGVFNRKELEVNHDD